MVCAEYHILTAHNCVGVRAIPPSPAPIVKNLHERKIGVRDFTAAQRAIRHGAIEPAPACTERAHARQGSNHCRHKSRLVAAIAPRVWRTCGISEPSQPLGLHRQYAYMHELCPVCLSILMQWAR